MPASCDQVNSLTFRFLAAHGPSARPKTEAKKKQNRSFDPHN